MSRPVALAVALVGVLTIHPAAADPPNRAAFDPAVRLGPGSEASTRGARVILVRQAGDAGSLPSAPRAVPGERRSSATELVQLETTWQQVVEQPLRVQRLGNATRLAEARVESYGERLELLRNYNFHAPPEANRFQAASVLPPPGDITPVRTPPPIQLFSPASTFAHSLDTAERRLEEAELELRVLRAMARTGGRKPALDIADEDLELSAEVRIEQVGEQLQRARFEVESFERRLAQMEQFSELTFSVPFSDLAEELRLGHLEAELRVAELESEQRLLVGHRETWDRMQALRERVARGSRP